MLLVCLYFLCSGGKKFLFCFFISVPSCRYFQSLLPNCTAYSIFLLWSKYPEQQWAIISLQFYCFTWNNRSTSRGWSVCTWLADSTLYILFICSLCISVVNISIFALIEHEGGAYKCVFRVGHFSMSHLQQRTDSSMEVPFYISTINCQTGF